MSSYLSVKNDGKFHRLPWLTKTENGGKSVTTPKIEGQTFVWMKRVKTFIEYYLLKVIGNLGTIYSGFKKMQEGTLDPGFYIKFYKVIVKTSTWIFFLIVLVFFLFSFDFPHSESFYLLHSNEGLPFDFYRRNRFPPFSVVVVSQGSL